MKKYVASRLSIGNRIFPAELIINDTGVTLKVPNILSGREKTIPFSRISSVDIDFPAVGFSSINIETTGEGRISVHGFLKKEVEEMKEIILAKVNSF